MVEKLLGKISSAEYGTVRDYPFLIGLQLTFSMNGCGVGDGGRYTVNMSKDCIWHDRNKYETVTKTVEDVYKLLGEAKVNYVSQLINKPVEVTIENNAFKDFRILTEVL